MAFLRAVDPKLIERTVEIRRRIHAAPELSFEEHRTAALVAEELAETRATVRTGVARTGVVARFVRDPDLPTVALRAEMDALPIREETGVPYASRNEGIMHACGHDGHTAILLGVSRILDERIDDFPGNVVLIFQPAEENGGGGREIVEAGVLDDPPACGAAALHGWTLLDVGDVGIGSGPILAATDGFHVEIEGPGGHGAHPDRTVDVVLVAARVIESLHSVVSREVDPVEPAVISVGRIQGGSANNVIPNRVEMAGTIRSLREETRRFLSRRVREIAEGTAHMAGGRAAVTIHEGYPVTRNDPDLSNLFRDVAADLLGEEHVHFLTQPSMGGEDFSYYGARVPSVMFRLGVRRPGAREWPSLHTSRFDFSDEAIPVGMLTLVNFAAAILKRHVESRD